MYHSRSLMLKPAITLRKYARLSLVSWDNFSEALAWLITSFRDLMHENSESHKPSPQTEVSDIETYCGILGELLEKYPCIYVVFISFRYYPYKMARLRHAVTQCFRINLVHLISAINVQSAKAVVPLSQLDRHCGSFTVQFSVHSEVRQKCLLLVFGCTLLTSATGLQQS